MALVINDRVKETSVTTGTGTFSLAGASRGFETFVAGVGGGNTTYYCINNSTSTGTEFEVGVGGIVAGTPNTLTRNTILSSSNSDNLVSFTGGEKDVFCTVPAKKAVSPVMQATGFVVTHSQTLDEDQTLDSGVLAGPVTVTGTQIITGTLVVI